ncbi:MAG TPA: hypothetical protein VFW77_04180, partial [Candidatus Saccharimonadales bacterium]|nr:hypothetical protein [Candidatus Saccharimonadales bacterium]
MAKKYKYLITKLAVFAVMVVGFSLFLSGGKVFAVDCPSAVDNIPPRWGVQDNNLANHFASVVVYAYNADTGNKIDGVKFRLNSNVDTAYNYGPAPSGLSDPTLYPSARIFKVHINSATNTIETDARYNQKSFTIGEQLTAPASPCPGWDELGPGTSDHQGNGYMLDCQEVDTNGNKHNNRFWIDQIDTPGGSDGANGGKWTVEVSTGGADLTSRHFPMSYDNYFAVANGQNARVHLIWHPKKAVHGGIVNTACFTTLATDIKGENS